MKKGINVLSLFDGMSCGQIALERAGIEVENYYASELDKYAIEVTQKNYPNTKQLGDVRNVTFFGLPKIDLLIGGSPCQGFSFAGKQLNFDDPRSKLFFEFVRLKEELQPKYFLLENVKMKKESEQVITKYLGVEPIEINSSLVSAQNRRRLYWTNIPGVTQPEDKGILLKDILEGNIAIELKNETAALNGKKSHCITARYSGAVAWNSAQKKQRTMVSIKKDEKDIFNPNNYNGVTYRKLTPVECERLQTVPDNYTNHVSNTQRYKMLGNGWTVDVIAHIFKNLK